jgi:DeoR family transcriptional regulator of aga operon
VAQDDVLRALAAVAGRPIRNRPQVDNLSHFRREESTGCEFSIFVQRRPSSRKLSKGMPGKRSGLMAAERRREIAKILKQDGRVAVDDLVQRFGVSAVTLRADLGSLAKQGVLVRSYGGAMLPQEPHQEYPLMVKETIHHAEKARIAKAAMELLSPHQTVILDSGTTTAEIARAIKRSGFDSLTVITHALNIAAELAENANISVIMTGGLMRHVSGSFVGPQAERFLSELHADHCFLGVDGLDPEHGLSTPDLLEAQLNTLMMKVSNEVTVVADASKLGRRSLSVIGDITSIKRLITDTRADEAMLEAVRKKGVEVVVA